MKILVFNNYVTTRAWREYTPLLAEGCTTVILIFIERSLALRLPVINRRKGQYHGLAVNQKTCFRIICVIGFSYVEFSIRELIEICDFTEKSARYLLLRFCKDTGNGHFIGSNLAGKKLQSPADFTGPSKKKYYSNFQLQPHFNELLQTCGPARLS